MQGFHREQIKSESQSMNIESHLNKLEILIVDHQVEARSALILMLKHIGARKIDVSHDGKEATLMMAEKVYDLVISDYDLGKGKDGQQLLEEARHKNLLKASAVYVLITSEISTDKVLGALECEPDAYISKPFTLNILLERLVKVWRVKDVLKPVHHAIDKGKNDLAISRAENALLENPSYFLPVSRLLGKLYMEEQQYSQGVELYENILKQMPTTWARLGHAVCVYHIKGADKAIKLFQGILDDNPLCVQCHDWIARILMEQEDTQHAQEYLESAVAISPRGMHRQIELGNLAIANKDYHVAQNAFEKSIRLGRNSRFKSPDNYTHYIEAAHQNISDQEENTRERRILGSKALRVLGEMRSEYSGQMDVIFDAHIAESFIHSLMSNKLKARTSADQAESTLKRIETPSSKQLKDLIDALNNTQQSTKAKKLQQEVDDLQLESENQEDEALVQAEKESDKFNSQGVKYYEQEKFAEAIEAFDQAVEFNGVGVSVLLNNIQAKVSYIEKQGQDLKLLKDCFRLFKRIGNLKEDDSRYNRYKMLRSNCQKLRKAAGV